MPTSNYLKTHIEALFTEITHLTANLNVLETFIVERGKDLLNNFPYPGFELYGMISTYRDLSQLKGGANLYDTNVGYSLTTDNLSSEVDRLISYISCLTITQAFEVFESYLKNTLAALIFNNPELITALKLEPEANSYDEIRTNLYKIQGKSNKGFIKVLRKYSPYFKSHEEDNIWQRNMSHWFEIIARVRDLVVHSRLIVNEPFLEYIRESHRAKLFQMHFEIEEVNHLQKLSLTPYQANSIISGLYEYAHLIYKSISIDYSISPDFNFKRVEL